MSAPLTVLGYLDPSWALETILSFSSAFSGASGLAAATPIAAASFGGAALGVLGTVLVTLMSNRTTRRIAAADQPNEDAQVAIDGLRSLVGLLQVEMDTLRTRADTALQSAEESQLRAHGLQLRVLELEVQLRELKSQLAKGGTTTITTTTEVQPNEEGGGVSDGNPHRS